MSVRQREYDGTFVVHRLKADDAVVDQVFFLGQLILWLKITKVKHNTHVVSTFVYQTRQIRILFIDLVINLSNYKIYCILRKLLSELIVARYFWF